MDDDVIKMYKENFKDEIEKTKDVVAGDISKLIIYPKDIYGNNVTNLTKDDLDKFNVDYEVNKVNKVDISKLCGIAEALLPIVKQISLNQETLFLPLIIMINL